MSRSRETFSSPLGLSAKFSTADDTEWVAGFEGAVHSSARCAFNNTRYNRDGFLQVYRGFSNAIGKNYGTGWQQWRDYYVASPDTWDPQGKGGVVTIMGFNGGVLRNQNVAANYPNAGFQGY
ncbi:hypothetical protein N0V90_006223 [Kalmusia sp. IMI 367209]|nr:hypothetical protein N0V90_006223 [Kalmusia sp. IMI 367209]